MATDKTPTTNYQQIPHKPPANPSKSSSKTGLYVLIIAILALSALYSFSSKSSTPHQVNANTAPRPPSHQVKTNAAPRPSRRRAERPKMDINVDEITKLSVQLKRSRILASPLTEQTFPMLVSLEVEDLALDYRAPLDLVCVIDHSGSMQGEKMELVKNTFKYLLHFLNDNDRLSIVTFDDQASTLVPLMNTTKGNKDLILSAVSTVHSRGGTYINGGFKVAIDLLNQRETINQVTGIFLLSDGLDNQGNYYANQLIKNTFKNSGLEDGGVIIHTFGFGRDHDPELMTSIADLTDGNFFFIDQLDHVDEAFVESLGALQTSIAENTEFVIKTEFSNPDINPVLGNLGNLEIVKAYGGDSMWTTYGRLFMTKSPSLITGRRKDFVLELKVPPFVAGVPEAGSPVEFTVASCQVTMKLPDSSEVIKKADLNVTFVGDVKELGDEEDNKEVMKHYYRVKGAELMAEARKLADQGRYKEAQQVLKTYKESVESSDIRNDELVKNMMEDMEKSMEYVSEEAYGMYGKQNLIGNQRAQMRQHNNLDSKVLLTNLAIDHMREVLYDL